MNMIKRAREASPRFQGLPGRARGTSRGRLRPQEPHGRTREATEDREHRHPRYGIRHHPFLTKACCSNEARIIRRNFHYLNQQLHQATQGRRPRTATAIPALEATDATNDVADQPEKPITEPSPRNRLRTATAVPARTAIDLTNATNGVANQRNNPPSTSGDRASNVQHRAHNR